MQKNEDIEQIKRDWCEVQVWCKWAYSVKNQKVPKGPGHLHVLAASDLIEALFDCKRNAWLIFDKYSKHLLVLQKLGYILPSSAYNLLMVWLKKHKSCTQNGSAWVKYQLINDLFLKCPNA